MLAACSLVMGQTYGAYSFSVMALIPALLVIPHSIQTLAHKPRFNRSPLFNYVTYILDATLVAVSIVLIEFSIVPSALIIASLLMTTVIHSGSRGGLMVIGSLSLILIPSALNSAIKITYQPIVFTWVDLLTGALYIMYLAIVAREGYRRTELLRRYSDKVRMQRNRIRALNKDLERHVSRSLSLKIGSAEAEEFTLEKQTLLGFVDISGFTDMMHKDQSIEAVRSVNNYLSSLAKGMLALGFEVDSYRGDGIFFYSTSIDDVELSAMYPKLIKHLNDFRCDLSLGERYPLTCALHLGDVYGGVLGVDRRQYTLMGSDVNYTQRLQEICPKNHFIISGELAKLINPELLLDQQGVKTVVGVRNFGDQVCYLSELKGM